MRRPVASSPVVLAWTARVAHVDAHARQQFVHVHRLADIVHAAHLEPFDHVLALGQAGHEDHGHVRGFGVGLDARGGLEAVHAGHHRVHQHQIGHNVAQQVQRRRARCRHQHGDPARFQRIGQQAQRIRFVIDDEHGVTTIGR
jgi:hypothetical protein